LSKTTIPVPFLVLFTEINLAKLSIVIASRKSEVVYVIMFSFIDTYYEDKVFLPDRNIYLFVCFLRLVVTQVVIHWVLIGAIA